MFSWQWVEPIAHVLANLGCEHVWVVHGHDGLDELTTTGSTDVAEVKDGKVTVFEVTPAMPGIAACQAQRPARRRCQDPMPRPSRDLLAGKKGPFRDIVLLNAAAALIVGGKATNLTDGVALAAHAIESGAARAALDASSRSATRVEAIAIAISHTARGASGCRCSLIQTKYCPASAINAYTVDLTQLHRWMSAHARTGLTIDLQRPRQHHWKQSIYFRVGYRPAAGQGRPRPSYDVDTACDDERDFHATIQASATSTTLAIASHAMCLLAGG